MPMPARDLWTKIQREIGGKTDREQCRILRRYLEGWHDSWRGPYADLKKRLLRRVQKLETTESVRSRDPAASLHVKRQGAAQVALVGLPNSGKSALVYALTGGPTVIADYPFATQQPVAGMLACEGGALQLVDTPPVVAGLSDGEGAGRALLHLIGAADAVAIVADLSADPGAQMETVLDELSTAHIQPIPGPLATTIQPKGRGGIRFTGLEIARSDRHAASEILANAGVRHAEVVIRHRFREEEVRAHIEHRKLIPALVLANKRDVAGAEAKTECLRAAYPDYRVLETDFFAETQSEQVVEALLALLGLIRVYAIEKPMAGAEQTAHLVPRASSVAEVAAESGSPGDTPLKSARVWGDSVAQPGQVVGLHHLAQEGDRIFLQT